jgi:putative ABC transport system ATP-binding protein
MEPIIRLDDVSMVYGGNGTRVAALDGLTLEIAPGEYMAVTGESGSGKSTLLALLGGLHLPTSGKVFMGGTDLSSLPPDGLSDVRRKNVGFVFQAYHLLPYLTARENVMVPMAPGKSDARRKEERAEALLDSVGLSGKGGRLPSQLSGGECQRVAIARALVHDPPLLLADEPTGNLDTATGEQILDLFLALNGDGRTVVLVTHNRGNAERTSRWIHLKDGRISGDTRPAAGHPLRNFSTAHAGNRRRI